MKTQYSIELKYLIFEHWGFFQAYGINNNYVIIIFICKLLPFLSIVLWLVLKNGISRLKFLNIF